MSKKLDQGQGDPEVDIQPQSEVSHHVLTSAGSNTDPQQSFTAILKLLPPFQTQLAP
jgi:hypothetical protein